MRPLAVGDLIRDNDPRMTARPVLAIKRFVGIDTLIYAEAAIPHCGRRQHRISVSRIHLDGKPRRSGWSRVTA